MSKLCRIVFLLILGALAGCKDDAPQTPSAPIQATAASPGGAAAEGFYVSSLTTTVIDGTPALQLDFSKPLATEQDFNAAISVTDGSGKVVDGGWSLDYGDQRVLRFAGIKAGADYQVKVASTLLAADGTELKNAFSEKVTGVQQPPAFGFAGRGSLLPARATEGLPMLSVNVEEVDVEFMRVRDERVPEALNDYALHGHQDSWRMDNLSKLAVSVYSNRFQIPDKRRNERVVSFLPVQNISELKRSGLYFAVMRRPGQFEGYEVTHYVVSDVGMHLRRYQTQALVLTRSLESGRALPAVKLSLINAQGISQLAGQTDERGQALLDIRPQAGQVLLAQRGEELSVLPFSQPALDLSEFAVSGGTADALTVFIWSGRDLYRPGETVRFSALLRDFDGRPLADQPVYATLKQPDGKIYASAELKPGKLGYLSWQRLLPEDVATGRWSIEFGTDPLAKGRQHSFSFRVEEFLPERLKLELNTSQAQLAAGETLDIAVQGNYLYGAPASGNRFTAKYSLAVDKDAVPQLKGYQFGDPFNAPASEQVDLLDAKLDAEGRISTVVAVPAETINGPIAVTVFGSVFETGGRAVTRTLKRSIWPAKALIGVRPLFADGDAGGDSRAGFEIVKANPDGSLVPVSGLQVKLIRVQRDYHWSYHSGTGWSTDFLEKMIDSGSEQLTLDGKTAGKLEFPVQWGGYRLEVTDPESKLVTRIGFQAGWDWSDDNRGSDARPDKVKLSLDKTAYKVGDKLKLSITPPHAGPGLLLIESDHLLATQEFDAKAGATIELTIPPEWDRHDVYLSTLVFKPGSNPDQITPKRALGMVHLPMDRSARAVKVELKVPAQMQPEKELVATVKVPELKGQEAYVALHAVDQGITNITRFEVPNPLKHFFAQRAFAIDLYDVYARIIEAQKGDPAKLRYGGDIELPGLPQSRRPTAKVLTVDLYSIPVQLDAEGNATVSLKVPDFNGSLRLSAVVYAKDRYGFASGETIVRAPVVVEVSTPRVFAPGDTGKLTVDIQNFTGKAGTFSLKASGANGLRVDQGQGSVELADGAKQTLSFDLHADEQIGVATFAVEVEGNGTRLQRKFETVIRPAWGEVRRTRLVINEQGGSIPLQVPVDDLLPSTVRSRISASTFAPIPVAEAAKELFDYPYGCIEQTTSKLIPYLLLDDATMAGFGMKALKPTIRERNVSLGLGRIASMQADNGDFNYWPGTDYSEPMLTPYVAEALLLAQKAGYTLPPQVLQKSLERLKETLLSGGEINYDRVQNDNSDHLRFAYNAYAAYVLSLVNQAPLGSLRNVYDNAAGKSLSPLPLVRLGLALKAAGDAKRGDAAIGQAFDARWAYPRDRWLGDFGSELRDHALSISLAASAGAMPTGADQRLLELMENVRNQPYMSTQERVALVTLGKALARGDRTFAGELSVGGAQESFQSKGLFARDLTIADLSGGATLSSAAKPLYLIQQTVGIPRVAPAQKRDPVSISRRYFRMDGTPFTGNSVGESEQLIVELSLESKITIQDALLVDLLPGGLEAENLNLLPEDQLSGLKAGEQNVSEARGSVSVRYEEFRDDRYVLALALNEGKTTYYYLVRAVSPGEYAVPPPMLEDMYRPELTAVGDAVPGRLVVSGGR